MHSNPLLVFWAGTSAQPTRLGWVQPQEGSLLGRSWPNFIFGLISAQPFFGPGRPSQKKYSKIILGKFVIFPCIFLRHFDQYRVVSLYRKNTNPVLKYPVFTKKNIFVFMYTAKSLKAKKSYCIFIQQRKLQKKLFPHAFLALITSLLKPRELSQYFKNSKKILLFS
jgi:hypothetical protein